MSERTIAVAVDGSPASEAALNKALSLARTECRPLAGIFVLDTGWADYIGNDWQSAAGARQGFLDYVREHLEQQAETARKQFNAATADLADTRFEVIPGEPLDTLCELIDKGEAGMLIAGREVFQVCGRPSTKRLTNDLSKRIKQGLVIV